MLRSVWIIIGGELVNHRSGDNVEKLCKKGYWDSSPIMRPWYYLQRRISGGVKFPPSPHLNLSHRGGCGALVQNPHMQTAAWMSLLTCSFTPTRVLTHTYKHTNTQPHTLTPTRTHVHTHTHTHTHTQSHSLTRSPAHTPGICWLCYYWSLEKTIGDVLWQWDIFCVVSDNLLFFFERWSLEIRTVQPRSCASSPGSSLCLPPYKQNKINAETFIGRLRA